MTLRKIVPIALLTALALGAAARPAHSDIPLPGPTPPPPSDTLGLPYVTSIHTEPAVPCAGQPTKIVFMGEFPTTCGALLKVDSDSLVVRLATATPSCGRCFPESLNIWSATIDLGTLAAGNYTVRVRFDVVDSCYTPDPKVDQYLGRVNLAVAPTCEQPDPMRFVDFVHITSADPTHDRICPDDSIRVSMGGTLSDCSYLRRIELLPSMIVGPLPEPPIVRLVFDDRCCVPVCDPLVRPWSAAVTLPPLPTMNYNLSVEAVEVCCRDSVLPGDPYGTRDVPFRVTTPESCSVGPRACLLPRWDHSMRVGECDTQLDPDHRAAATLGVRSSIALAGLQGSIDVGSSPGAPRLVVVAADPVGFASGSLMHLTWRPTPEGATFVLFADSSAPIPATDSTGAPVPVIRFTFARAFTDSGPPPPDTSTTANHWYLYAHDLLGADIDGHGVPMCPVRQIPDIFVICDASGTCDLNSDSHADVRDLVLMVHCLNGTGPCPADPPTALDCDGDHDFDLDDVMCCARRVLLTPQCPGCWGDSARAEPAIAVQFGTPQRVGDGYDIPVRIDDAGRIGAARLALRMPDALAAGASVRTATGDPHWLVLDEARAGERVVGVMNLVTERSPAHGPISLDLVLHVPATTGTAEITLGTAEFSGGDGVRLVTDLGAPAVRIGGGVSLVLDAAKPNPFAATTAFALSVDAAADVDLGVYDLAGRRVASLYHGRLEVGVHRFSWDGRVDGGARAGAGVYFVRASGAGASTVRKLILVKG